MRVNYGAGGQSLDEADVSGSRESAELNDVWALACLRPPTPPAHSTLLPPSISQQMAAAGPLDEFDAWFKLASSCGLAEPNAMSLATAVEGGRPSVRYVLLKGYDERGFIFYSNYDSAKASWELASWEEASLGKTSLVYTSAEKSAARGWPACLHATLPSNPAAAPLPALNHLLRRASSWRATRRQRSPFGGSPCSAR